MKQLGGLVSKSNQPSIDADRLHREFIVDKSLQPVGKFDNVDSSPLFVFPSEILRYLNSLKPLKAAGSHNVSPFLLKKCSHILAEPLSFLLSRYLKERKFPDCWRAVKITLIPKKDSDRFRSIACTSVLLKLLEKFILSKLCTFLPNLDYSQFAYCPKYSTLDAVASLVHFIASSLDKKNKFIRLCFLDFSNTFNNLDRNALCSLLHLKGSLLQSYPG